MKLSAQTCRSLIEIALGCFRDEWLANDVNWRYHLDERKGEGMHRIVISCSLPQKITVPLLIVDRRNIDYDRKEHWNAVLKKVLSYGVRGLYRSAIVKILEGDDTGMIKAIDTYPIEP